MGYSDHLWRMCMNVLKLVSQGGLAMMPLLVLSVIALAIVLERTLFFAS